MFGSGISAAIFGTDWALLAVFFATCMGPYEYENRVTIKNDHMDINYLIKK